MATPRLVVFRNAILVIVSIVAGPLARADTLTNYAGHAVEDRSVVISSDTGQRVRVTPYGDATLRIQVRASGAFTPDGWGMVERHDRGGTLAIARTDSALELTTPGGVTLRVATAPMRLAVIRAGAPGPLLVDADGPSFEAGRAALRFARDPAERFAGLGHGFFGRVGKLDLTGTAVARNYGTAGFDQAPLIVPFYLSSKGYGVFVNSGLANRFRFGADNRYDIELAGSDELDYFVFLGPTLIDVLEQYTALTGRPRLPPLAMFGLALSDKGAPDDSSAAWWRAKVREHRAHGWPLDHLVNDNRWRANGGERCRSSFGWDPARYPDPAAFQRWARASGLVVTLDFNRCIADQTPGWRPEFNLPSPGATDFPTSAPDLTRADTRRWWWDAMWRGALDPALGYPGDALWIDEFDELGAAPADQVLGDGRTWAAAKNTWFLQIARALVADGWDPAFGAKRRPFVWVRGMTAGGQRYGTLWSGDISPTFGEMKLQIRGMLAAGLAGFPYWGHDAGGFDASGVPAAEFDNLYRQWAMAFGAFTPYWKPHGVGPSRWPSDRNGESQSAATTYGELRYRLLPYTYSIARDAARTGTPIARAMLLAYPDRAEAWTRDQQYLWGSDLLVAPNAAAGYNTVPVWLPPGRWYDVWNDDALAGDRAIDAWAPLGRVLLYARAGAIVPMAPAASSTQALRRDVVELHVYDGADGEFVLREDDGVSDTGGERATVLRYHAATRTLTIGGAAGTYAGAPATRSVRIQVHGLDAPSCARLDGGDLPQLRDEQALVVNGQGAAWIAKSTHGVLALAVPAAAVTQERVVELVPCREPGPNATRIELEAGATNATPGAKPVASGGRYVGGLNVVGRFVDVAVTAPAAGAYELVIGYANGRGATAVRGLYLAGTRVRDLVFPPTPDWDAFTRAAPVTIELPAGATTLRIATDAGDPETIDLDYVDVRPADEAPRAVVEASGLVDVEAERWTARTDGGAHGWQAITTAEGYGGDGAVAALPDLGARVEPGAATARLAYAVELTTAGPYHVWVRGRAYGDAARDEVALALGGDEQVADFAAADEFVWVRAGTLTAPAAGRQTLALAMREDGAVVDRIILAIDPAYDPTATEPEPGPEPGPDPSGSDAGVDPVPGPGPDAPGAGCGCGSAPDAGGLLVLLALTTRAAGRRRSRARCGSRGSR